MSNHGHIYLYSAHGHPAEATITGCVIKGTRRTPIPSPRVLTRIWGSISQFRVRVLSGVVLNVTIGDRSTLVHSDSRGQFVATLGGESAEPLPPGLHEVSVRAVGGERSVPECRGEVYIYGPRQPFGVISDYDDTLVFSHVTSRLRMIHDHLMHQPDQVVPVAGMERLYRALAHQGGNELPFPAFYVSASPSQLHHRIVSTLDFNGFPRGPLFLKALGLAGLLPRALARRLAGRPSGPHAGKLIYKLATCQAILDRYPWMQFYCFGDSGQADAEVYTQLANRERNQGRIPRIFIHDLTPHTPRSPAERLHYFRTPSEAARILHTDGVLSDEGLTQVQP